MALSKKRQVSTPADMPIAELSVGRIHDPWFSKPGYVEGSLGPYRWKLNFDYGHTHGLEHLEHMDDWAWHYAYRVTLNGHPVYEASLRNGYIPKDILGDDYLRELCAGLAQQFIDEGPVA